MRTFAFRLSLVFIFLIPWEGVLELPGMGSAARLIGLATARVGLVHAAQIFDDFSRLMEARDRKVSVVVTPEGVLRMG